MPQCGRNGPLLVVLRHHPVLPEPITQLGHRIAGRTDVAALPLDHPGANRAAGAGRHGATTRTGASVRYGNAKAIATSMTGPVNGLTNVAFPVRTSMR
jgi:hypothetical protein